MKDIKNDTLNNVLGSATEKLPKKGSVLPINREGQEKKFYPVKEFLLARS
jgi:hypothetical protein